MNLLLRRFYRKNIVQFVTIQFLDRQEIRFLTLTNYIFHLTFSLFCKKANHKIAYYDTGKQYKLQQYIK